MTEKSKQNFRNIFASKQINSLLIKEREKYCVHNHTPYSGRIPCTGPLVCTMCNMHFNNYEDRNLARKIGELLNEKV